MIVIATRLVDISTSNVIDYLIYIKLLVFRINQEDVLNINDIQINNDISHISITLRNNELDLSQFNSVWYRQGVFGDNIPINLDNYLEANTNSYLLKYLKMESHSLVDFLFYFMHTNLKRHLGNYIKQNINKLQTLIQASKNELHIPKSEVTTSKKKIKDYFYNSQSLITKSIQEMFASSSEGKKYLAFTNCINISKISNTFFPSLIQEKLDKAYELRIFFMNEDYYAMAIFSQLDPQTSIDFRNYNDEKPNRTVPYKLPIDILEKLKRLMNDLKLNTGSIDMVVTKDKRYVFLEVNPVGQFGMVSIPCNYYLEKKIAEFLAGK